MLRSMTGYGRGENVDNSRRFIVEIRAVNHKYNDIAVKLPRTMSALEDKIRKFVGKSVFRGKVDVYVSLESFASDDVLVKVNTPLAEAYYNAVNTLKEGYAFTDSISLNTFVRFPDILTIEKAQYADNAIWQSLLPALESAVVMFVGMRENEGASLFNNIFEKINRISILISNITKRSPFVAEEYRQKLMARMTEILIDTEIDESRILTEAALFADKACIDEELTRLNSHISQMSNVLSGAEQAIGRKLDFIVQEMNREVNTISSKSNDIEITNTAIELKSEIEKIREQIQNIE